MPSIQRLVRSTYRTYTRNRTAILSIIAFLALETLYNIHSFNVPRPSKPLDPPFSTQCQEPDTSSPRENATILMLARNSDVHGAVASVRSLENAFNHWYHYPITFLNDKPFDDTFIDALTAASSGAVDFATIDASLWGYPAFVDQPAAKASIEAQGRTHVMYSGLESYHHMCRFNSGGFYDVPALQRYRWYWRIEPDVEYTCAITYDPFAAMARNKKKYGYVVALWEIGDTCPSLFRTVADYRRKAGLRATALWTAMMDASWAPVPVRWLLGRLLANRDRSGDAYNLCHFWSNFEIADMDWYRGEEYRAFFRMLDEEGGFYFERWGDAPVHSLATALLLKPEEVHHFADFGYVHENFQTCPGNAKGGQLLSSKELNSLETGGRELEPETEGALGCRCRCPKDKRGIPSDCLDRIRQSVE